MSLASEISALARRAPEVREIKTLGGLKVGFRHISLAERDEYERRMFDKDAGSVTVDSLIGVRGYLIATVTVDPSDNKQMFTESEVAAFDSDIAIELHEAAQEVNGLKKKAVEDEAGN